MNYFTPYQRTPHPCTYVGTQGSNTHHPISLQLASHLCHRGPHANQLLVPASRRQHQEGRACRIPQGAQGSSETAPVGDMGWRQVAPQRLRGQPGRAYSNCLSATLRPDLNPVEYLWAWPKRHAMANYCPDNLSELQTTARNKLKSAQKRPTIIAACWAQANLW